VSTTAWAPTVRRACPASPPGLPRRAATGAAGTAAVSGAATSMGTAGAAAESGAVWAAADEAASGAAAKASVSRRARCMEAQAGGKRRARTGR